MIMKNGSMIGREKDASVSRKERRQEIAEDMPEKVRR
jgi:hypothetical protein